MNRHLNTLALLLTTAALLTTGDACSTSMAQDTPTPPAQPVVLELFTSQGCSSCPPADRVLSDYGKTTEVIPLAFHVDYWDYIGWKDPFASAAWSNRQRDYARARKSERIYTPQLIINGGADVVGSNRSGAGKAIAEAAASPPIADLTIQRSLVPGARKLRVSIAVKPRKGAPDAPHNLMVALFENGIDTRVGRGENSGRTLHNDHIVRRLEKACTLTGPDAGARTCELILDLDPDWNTQQLGVAAFAQHPGTLAIRAAAASPTGL